jgi:hypothetical protein
MPDGMLYADRPMVHKGYLLANRISITTEPVYYWRKRGSNIVNKSITQLKTSLDNFLDRMESINYQINYFKQLADETMLNEFLHRNIDRLFFPIVQIRFDKVFRDIYLKETRRILSLIKDVHDNKLGITKNLYIKFILEENEDALLYLLTYPLKGKVKVSEGAYFWQTQFETHERFQVPLNFFELKEFNADMVKIAKAEVNVGKLAFHNVSIVPIKKISKVTLLIAERKDGPIIYRKAMTKGKLGYSIEILDKDIQKKFCLGSYDIYIGFWSDGEFIRYRVKKSMIKTYIIDATKSNRYYFTENDLMSWHNVKDKGIEFQALEDRLVVKFKSETKYPYEKFMLIDRRAKTQIDFYYRDGRHELPYSQFGDFTLKHFDVYVQLGREKLRIHKKWLRTKLVNKIFQNNGKIIELYITPKGNLAITSYTKLVRLMTNMKKQFRKIFSA